MTDTQNLYRVECNMMGGLAQGARVKSVISWREGEPSKPNPYMGTKEQAERTAAELRACPEGYRNVEVIPVSELEVWHDSASLSERGWAIEASVRVLRACREADGYSDEHVVRCILRAALSEQEGK